MSHDAIWDRAIHALTLLAIDPAGLGGAVVRARCGPVRDAFSEAFHALPAPILKLHPAMDDDALFGGVDLTETLTRGALVMRHGLIGRDGTAVLAMSERCEPSLAARLAQAIDDQQITCLIAMDEGAEADEHTPNALQERLAFHIDLTMPVSAISLLPDGVEIMAARTRIADIKIDDGTVETLINLCAQLGITSARAPLFAVRTARANAALHEHDKIEPSDIKIAAAMCLAHRATHLPPAPDTPEENQSQPETQDTSETDTSTEIGQIDDRVLDAVMAMLPDGLLDQFRPKGNAGRGSGAGSKHRGNRRGRPKVSRAGRLSGRNRLDLIATLRTAAPWQKLRGATPGRIKVLPSDFRIRQFEEKSDRLLIFAVDASGSAAIARLGEAKGAVELLLADAYSRRDHVCLVSFRGESAETLLPPTRSLVQTKKRLAALPGGGGTPLAAGMIEALTLSHQARAQGMTPCIVLLTDGRANIALDGTADRGKAGADAQTVARQIRAHGTDTITLDLGTRPSAALSELAATMDGFYVPLPRADARKMSIAVADALGQ